MPSLSAESLASESINRAFAENSQVTAVSVKVVGERNGQETQVISATVSRSHWQKQPKIQLWTQYLRKAGLLLGFIQLQQPKPIVTKQPNAIEKEQLAAATHQEPNFFDINQKIWITIECLEAKKFNFEN